MKIIKFVPRRLKLGDWIFSFPPPAKQFYEHSLKNQKNVRQHLFPDKKIVGTQTFSDQLFLE